MQIWVEGEGEEGKKRGNVQIFLVLISVGTFETQLCVSQDGEEGKKVFR